MGITCTLKHATETDLVLPISSASSRMKPTADTSAISVVIPNGIYYSADISDRIAGWIELSIDGVTFAYSDTIVSAPLYEGAGSTSIQINAEGNYPSSTPPDATLTGVTYMSLTAEGAIRIRSEFDPAIEPGSTVTYDSVDYTVDAITYSISAGSASTFELAVTAQ